MRLPNTLAVYVQLGKQTHRAGELGGSFVGGRDLGGSWFRYDPAYLNVDGAYPLSRELDFSHGPIYTGADRSLELKTMASTLLQTPRPGLKTMRLTKQTSSCSARQRLRPAVHARK